MKKVLVAGMSGFSVGMLLIHYDNFRVVFGDD